MMTEEGLKALLSESIAKLAPLHRERLGQRGEQLRARAQKWAGAKPTSTPTCSAENKNHWLALRLNSSES